MGNWHCIPSSCAEVVYQEYLSPKIRWRYGNEPWQEIVGADNFTTELLETYPRNTNYRFVYRSSSLNGGVVTWSNDSVRFQSDRFNGIQSWRLKVIQKGKTIYPADNKFFTYVIVNGAYDSAPVSDRTADFYVEVVSQGVTTTIFIGSDSGLWGQRFIATDGQANPINCVFKIFKNNQLIRTETRSVCPEVEKIPCRLSGQIKSVEIKKLPYLEKVEVVPYQYSAYRVPGVPAPIVQADQIPLECLNIYNNAIYVIPPSGQGIYPNATPFDSFVAQICSIPGCLPPEYQVICNCKCESCPGDTCPIKCGDHICCYNDYGVSIKEIPLSDYCGGNS